jgi:hypothetical protein
MSVTLLSVEPLPGLAARERHRVMGPAACEKASKSVNGSCCDGQLMLDLLLALLAGISPQPHGDCAWSVEAWVRGSERTVARYLRRPHQAGRHQEPHAGAPARSQDAALGTTKAPCRGRTPITTAITRISQPCVEDADRGEQHCRWRLPPPYPGRHATMR